MSILRYNINNQIKTTDLRHTGTVELENVIIKQSVGKNNTRKYLHITSIKDEIRVDLFISTLIEDNIVDITQLNLSNIHQTPIHILLYKFELTRVAIGRTTHQQYDTIELLFNRENEVNEINNILEVIQFNNSKNTSALIQTYKNDEYIEYSKDLTLEQMYKSEATHQFITKVFRNKYVIMEISTNNLGKIIDASIVSIVKPGKRITLEDNIFGLKIKSNLTINKTQEVYVESDKVKFKLNEIAYQRQLLKYKNTPNKLETIKRINKNQEFAIKSALLRINKKN